MQHMLTKPSNKGGFTIVEVIVIVTVGLILLPLVMSTLGNIYTSTSSSSKKSTQNTDARTALRSIENDLAYSPGFLDRKTVLSSYYGPDNNATGSTSWTAVTSGTQHSIIAEEYATGTQSGQRVPVFASSTPSVCASPEQSAALKNTIIYFIGTDPANASVSNLYKRTLLDTTGLVAKCAASPNPDQKTTCRATVQVGACTRGALIGNDALIFRNIDRFTTEYYSDPRGTTTTSLTASNNPPSIKITILPKKVSNVVPEAVSIRITPVR